MVVTQDINLPTEEELTVQEVNLSSPALRAGSFHLGKYCEKENNEFMLCRDELGDPRKCLNEGKAVTNCALNFFRKMKKSCNEEFEHCRKTQTVFDKCALDTLGLERPDYGYFCRPHVHNTARPKPQLPEKDVYPDATPGLPQDYPKPPAKHGSRYIFLN
ncbi:hypothetical protein B566_EDAN001299 [Ephemera danica]|nr:hypothetical protein B566_EDAN001299 [Ephemera danica]